MARKPIDFAKERDRRDARIDRLLQSAAILELYKRANDREAQDLEDKNEGVGGASLAGPIDPCDILSKEQIAEVLRKFERR